MKKVALILLPIFIISVLFLTYRPANAGFNSIFFQSACSKPITYRIGEIDPQFGVSENEFKNHILKAEGIWEKEDGKNLFEYNANANLKINLVFDERQQNFDKTKNISNQVKNLGSEVDELGNKLTADKNNLEPEIAAYQSRVLAFNDRIQKLNTDIQYWNSQGGAPADEFERLNTEKEALSKEADELNKKSEELNKLRQSYNNQVSSFNSELNQLNQKTGQLKDSIQTLQEVMDEKPEEGLYDPQLQKIDIYFNVDELELVQTLAHELGHARGLAHNENKKSIMYSFTNRESSPSAEDLRDLNIICREKSLPEIGYESFQNIIFHYTQLIQGYL